MALLNTSLYLLNPYFMDQITHITRAQSINQYGVSVLTETPSTVYASVQGKDHEYLARNRDDAVLRDRIDVYARVTFTTESVNGYADIVVWQGGRYIVESVTENYENYGIGWSHAVCVSEFVNNDE